MPSVSASFACFVLLGLVTERAERDLRGVKKLGAVLAEDDVHEHAVGSAGDEIADALVVGERRHGAAVSLVSVVGGVDLVFSSGDLGFVAVLPGAPAAGDGGV